MPLPLAGGRGHVGGPFTAVYTEASRSSFTLVLCTIFEVYFQKAVNLPNEEVQRSCVAFVVLRWWDLVGHGEQTPKVAGLTQGLLRSRWGLHYFT